VDTKGELIGINTGIFSKSGGYLRIGFAIPMILIERQGNKLFLTVTL